VDYRDVLATVVGASVAGIVAFAIRLIFPINAAVLALVYAATYSLLWSIVGDHAKQLFHRYLPASTRLDGHWRLVTGAIALVAAASAGLIVAYALSRPTSVISTTTPSAVSSLITQTVRLQPRVVVNKKTIVLPVETRVVTNAVAARVPGQTATIISRTVVVQRPAVTITVSSTEKARTATVTQTTPAVTAPATTPTTVTTTAATSPLPLGTTAEPAPTVPPDATTTP
jgi:hypothetical protein